MPKTRILPCHSLVMHELSRNSLAEIVAAHSLEITPDSPQLSSKTGLMIEEIRSSQKLEHWATTYRLFLALTQHCH